MFYSYTPEKVCSHNIEFEIDNGIVRKVQFAGGCNGNLKAMAALVEGLPCEVVIEKLGGIQCGLKGTSCGDQLAKAIAKAMSE